MPLCYNLAGIVRVAKGIFHYPHQPLIEIGCMDKNLSAPVLVLNANYEPLNVCTTRRAMGLIVRDKASLILNGRGVVRTVSREYLAPSVIRLDYMIKRPRPKVRLNKAEVLRRDRYTCQYCGRKTKQLTVDHIIPKSNGGGHHWENLTAACPRCNTKKGNRTYAEANMPLLSKPKVPKASLLYIFERYLFNNREWLPFIEGW